MIRSRPRLSLIAVILLTLSLVIPSLSPLQTLGQDLETTPATEPATNGQQAESEDTPSTVPSSTESSGNQETPEDTAPVATNPPPTLIPATETVEAPNEVQTPPVDATGSDDVPETPTGTAPIVEGTEAPEPAPREDDAEEGPVMVANLTASEGGFGIDVSSLDLACDTTVSFTASFDNSAGFTDIETNVLLRLFDNEADFLADTAPLGLLGDSSGPLPLHEGFNSWSGQFYTVPVTNADTLYLRAHTRLVGYSPDGAVGRVEQRDNWTTSVSGCADEAPPTEPDRASEEADDETPPPTPRGEVTAYSVDDITCLPGGGGRVAGSVTIANVPPKTAFYNGLTLAVIYDASWYGHIGNRLNIPLDENGFSGTVPFDLAFTAETVDENPVDSIRLEVRHHVFPTSDGFNVLFSEEVDVSKCGEDAPPTEEPTEEPTPPTLDIPTITSLSVNMTDACAFAGGTGTVTGTSTLSREVAEGELLWINLSIGWDVPGEGFALWTNAHWGPNNSAYDVPLSLNGPWSVSNVAYDPNIGAPGGRPRPDDATALVVRMTVAQQGGQSADERTVRLPLADCDGVPEEPTEEPTQDPTEEPTEEPTQEPTEEPTMEPTEPVSDEDQPLPVSFTLCGTPDCAPPHNTAADGYTVSWTVASLDGNDRAGILSFFAVQTTEPFTISAVLQGGVAVAQTHPLPAGDYEICLNPILTGPGGSTIRIASGPLCETRGHGAGDNGEVPGVSFSVVVIGAPDVTPGPATGEEPGPATPPTNGEPATPGGADSDDDRPSVIPPSARTSDSSTGTPGSNVTTTLPVTGAGHASPSTFPAWALMMVAVMLLATGVGVRRRSR